MPRTRSWTRIPNSEGRNRPRVLPHPDRNEDDLQKFSEYRRTTVKSRLKGLRNRHDSEEEMRGRF